MSQKWKAVHLAKVSCCGRTYALGFDITDTEQFEFIADHIAGYVNVTYERYTVPGDHTGGRFMCPHCPRKKSSGRTIFPEKCDYEEALS